MQRQSDLTLHVNTLRLVSDTGEVYLPPAKFRLLFYLTLHPGVIRTRNQILDAVSVYENLDKTDRTIDSHIKLLRKLIAQVTDTPVIETHYRVGYSARPINHTKPVEEVNPDDIPWKDNGHDPKDKNTRHKAPRVVTPRCCPHCLRPLT